MQDLMSLIFQLKKTNRTIKILQIHKRANALAEHLVMGANTLVTFVKGLSDSE